MKANNTAPCDFSGARSAQPLVLFVLLCIVSGAGVVAYAWHSLHRTPLKGDSEIPASSVEHHKIREIRIRPHLLFRNTVLGPMYGRLSLVSLAAPSGTRYFTELSCERVYGTAASGLCLQASRGVFTTYRALQFDRDFGVLHTFELPGAPSRTRVSYDGLKAATTVFVRGDSYNSGGFSTRTTLFDLSNGQIIDDLENFKVTNRGEPFRRVDFNLWGVTFVRNSERFFATLGSGGILYLVEGDLSLREMHVIREGVECPSISPNGESVVFKSRIYENGRMIWRLHVLNFKTGGETAINEIRSVDDQAEWFDNEHVLYALPRNVVGSPGSDVWIASADGTGVPRIFIADASSPCVVYP